jgi:L-alanine-DL-glutamate epimerase-like enolase superfamily enzyme
MHVMKAIPNAGKYLEFSIEESDYYPWQNGLFQSNPFTITDGHVTITDAPGWGVDVNLDWLENAQYAVSDAANWEPSAYGQLYGTPPA